MKNRFVSAAAALVILSTSAVAAPTRDTSAGGVGAWVRSLHPVDKIVKVIKKTFGGTRSFGDELGPPKP